MGLLEGEEVKVGEEHRHGVGLERRGSENQEYSRVRVQSIS